MLSRPFPARLFSSADQKTVERHFRWMRDYRIDGAFLQRFLVELGDPSADRVLGHVRAAATTGRVYAVCYDLTDAPKDKLYDLLVADWKRLVDEAKITQDSRYLHHNKKPVLFVWGFYSDRFGPDLANRIIDFFKNDPKYGVTLIGGCQWWWRAEKNPEWAKVFRRFDVISPWNVGNFVQVGGRRQASTGYWKADLAEAKKAGMAYLPVIYPGFGWTNLKGRAAAKDALPRLRGEFYWRQFSAAADLGMAMAYVDWPRPPLILGLVLGKLIERNLFIAYSRYEFSFLLRPILMVIMVVALGLVLAPLIRGQIQRRFGKGPPEAGELVLAQDR